SLCEPEAIIQAWVTTFVRMLLLGILPGALPSLRTGLCCQPQNACINGGFVDLDSLTPIVDIPTNTAMYAALQLSTEALVSTGRSLGTDSGDTKGIDDRGVRCQLHYLNQYVLGLIRQAMTLEMRSGIELDERIRKYYAPELSFDSFVEQLSPSFYASGRDSVPADRDFRTFELSLITAIKDRHSGHHTSSVPTSTPPSTGQISS